MTSGINQDWRMRTSHSSSSTQTFVPVSFIFSALKNINEGFVATTCILTRSYCNDGSVRDDPRYTRKKLTDRRSRTMSGAFTEATEPVVMRRT